MQINLITRSPGVKRSENVDHARNHASPWWKALLPAPNQFMSI